MLKIFRELSEKSQICEEEVNVLLLSSQKHLNLQTQQTGIPRPGNLQQLYSHELDCGNIDNFISLIKGRNPQTVKWKFKSDMRNIIENTST